MTAAQVSPWIYLAGILLVVIAMRVEVALNDRRNRRAEIDAAEGLKNTRALLKRMSQEKPK